MGYLDGNFNMFGYGAASTPLPYIPTISRQTVPLLFGGRGSQYTPTSTPIPMVTNSVASNLPDVATASANLATQIVNKITSSLKSFVSSTVSRPVSTGGGASSTAATIGSNQNSSAWSKLGYCAEAGMRLAKTALNSVVGFIGYCCRYVKNAIKKSGLGEYVSGNACDMVSIMRNNKKFKEINPAGVNVKNLPAGCVLVYGRSVAGYSSKYGHVEISTGDGKCVSDGITRNPRNNPTAIFMPISA